MTTTETDFQLIDHGSIIVLRPRTDLAHDWTAQHLPDDAMTWAGGTVIEPRYICDILDGLTVDGLTVAQL